MPYTEADALRDIGETLWPDGKLDMDWGPNQLDRIADFAREAGYAPIPPDKKVGHVLVRKPDSGICIGCDQPITFDQTIGWRHTKEAEPVPCFLPKTPPEMVDDEPGIHTECRVCHHLPHDGRCPGFANCGCDSTPFDYVHGTHGRQLRDNLPAMTGTPTAAAPIPNHMDPASLDTRQGLLPYWMVDSIVYLDRIYGFEPMDTTYPALARKALNPSQAYALMRRWGIPALAASRHGPENIGLLLTDIDMLDNASSDWFLCALRDSLTQALLSNLIVTSSDRFNVIAGRLGFRVTGGTVERQEGQDGWR